MVTNRVRELLDRGEVALGVECAFGEPLIAELLAAQGFDWVMLDGQHGTWQRQSFAHGFMGVRAGGATPFARVPQNEYFAIGHVLDEGALGIVVPMVETAAEAARASQASRFPPRGRRSQGRGGALAYGPDYQARINDELVVAVQIETATGLENADEIMATDGIDACWVGPGDLSVSIGHAIGTPEHEAAVLEIFAACKRHGKAAGIYTGRAEDTRKWIEAGGTLMLLGAEREHVLAGTAADAEAFGRKPRWPS